MHPLFLLCDILYLVLRKKVLEIMENKVEERKMYKVWAIWNYVEAFLLICAGVLGVVFGSISDLSNSSSINMTIAIVAGLFVILDGILRIFMALASMKESEESILLIAGFEVSIGIVIMLTYTIFIELLIKFLAVLLIVMGVLLVLFSIFSIIKKTSKTFMPILEILFGAVLVSVGIAVLIMFYSNDPSISNKIMILVAGIIMALAGVAQLIVATIQYKKSKKKYGVSLKEEEENKVDKNDKKSNKKSHDDKQKVIDVQEVKDEEIKKIGQKEESVNKKEEEEGIK